MFPIHAIMPYLLGLRNDITVWHDYLWLSLEMFSCIYVFSQTNRYFLLGDGLFVSNLYKMKQTCHSHKAITVQTDYLIFSSIASTFRRDFCVYISLSDFIAKHYQWNSFQVKVTPKGFSVDILHITPLYFIFIYLFTSILTRLRPGYSKKTKWITTSSSPRAILPALFPIQSIVCLSFTHWLYHQLSKAHRVLEWTLCVRRTVLYPSLLLLSDYSKSPSLPIFLHYDLRIHSSIPTSLRVLFTSWILEVFVYCWPTSPQARPGWRESTGLHSLLMLIFCFCLLCRNGRSDTKTNSA